MGRNNKDTNARRELVSLLFLPILITIKDTNARRELVRFLEEGSTPFYADKVMKWIESKIEFANESNWFI